MFCTAASVMLAMKAAHASDAHVSGVRGLSSSSSSLPQEEGIWPHLYVAPAHVLSENGESVEGRPQSAAVTCTT